MPKESARSEWWSGASEWKVERHALYLNLNPQTEGEVGVLRIWWENTFHLICHQQIYGRRENE